MFTSFICIFLGLYLFTLGFSLFIYNKYKKIQKKQKDCLLVDLELATTEQILTEFSNRKTPLIVLQPIPTNNGLVNCNINCFNISTHGAINVLGVCCQILMTGLKSQPNLEEGFE